MPNRVSSISTIHRNAVISFGEHNGQLGIESKNIRTKKTDTGLQSTDGHLEQDRTPLKSGHVVFTAKLLSGTRRCKKITDDDVS